MFEQSPEDAIRHYAVGVHIGELSLPPGFEGLLPWGHIDNRPFLCCMHAYGLCLWRLGRSSEAQGIFDRMLWLNPSDNEGIRFLMADLATGKSWEEQHAKEDERVTRARRIRRGTGNSPRETES